VTAEQPRDQEEQRDLVDQLQQSPRVGQCPGAQHGSQHGKQDQAQDVVEDRRRHDGLAESRLELAEVHQHLDRDRHGGDRDGTARSFDELPGTQFKASQEHQEEDRQVSDGAEDFAFRQAGQDR
jgi:hypothetical protein